MGSQGPGRKPGLSEAAFQKFGAARPTCQLALCPVCPCSVHRCWGGAAGTAAWGCLPAPARGTWWSWVRPAQAHGLGLCGSRSRNTRSAHSAGRGKAALTPSPTSSTAPSRTAPRGYWPQGLWTLQPVSTSRGGQVPASRYHSTPSKHLPGALTQARWGS